MVCIDDFAIWKKESYGTIMVDIETHRVIDLLGIQSPVSNQI